MGLLSLVTARHEEYEGNIGEARGGAGKMNRKLAALTGAIALVGALGACSSSSSSTGAAATTSAAPKPTTAQPLSGTGTGTLTLSLTTGAATADFTGHLSPLGAETGHDNLQFTLTGASTYTYTGTRTFVAANGDKLFSNITGKGTFTSTTTHSTETDTITGGTGRFAGATGTYTETISAVVVSTTATTQVSRVTAAAHGQILY